MISLEWLVGTSAALATFVASVMGEEQETRLRNGTFGAIAGSSMGGFAALLKNQPELLLVGVLGSTIGATGGWLIYLLLSWGATYPTGRRILNYQMGGLQAVLNQLRLDTIDQQMLVLRSWGEGFRRMVALQKQALLSGATDDKIELTSRSVIEGWLTSFTDVLNMIFELADEKDYRSRIAIIVFGSTNKGETVGKYWLRYAGKLDSHRDQVFGTTSIAYRVLDESLRSPSFQTFEDANTHGEKRPPGQAYKSFIAFRINSSAVMVLDWPGANDQRVDIAQSVCHQDLVPAIKATLDRWSKPLQREVELDELPTKTTPPLGSGGTGSASAISR
jgi:hypothetical protein